PKYGTTGTFVQARRGPADRRYRSVSLLDVLIRCARLRLGGGGSLQAGGSPPLSCIQAARQVACGRGAISPGPNAASRSISPPGPNTWMTAAYGTCGNARPVATRSRRWRVSPRDSGPAVNQR